MPLATFGAGAAHRERTFEALDASAHAFDGAEFDTCLFRACSFAGAALKRWRLTDCRFEDCDLTAARLRGAFDHPIDARQTKMTMTRVSLPEAVSLLAGLDVTIENEAP